MAEPTTTTLPALIAGVNPYPHEVPFEKPVDENGVLVYERDGVRYRHPVGQSQYGLSLFESYRVTGNTEWLRLAEVNAQDLIDTTMVDGMLEYPFDFALHGDPDNTLHALWRSAMAQGQYLSLVVRLWEETGNPHWRTVADQTLVTLTEQDREDWVTFTDDNGMVWLEEYAGDVEPMRVLNGHIFAMFGLYDYHQATGSVEALELFWAAGDTVLRYMPEWREPGEISWYGLRVQNLPIAQSPTYHGVHIGQLRALAEMTGDPRFGEWADLLESDFLPD